MRTTALLTSALSLLSLASARIYGIATPSQFTPDSTVKVDIIAQDYIQAVQDVAISFGLQPAQTARADTLGSLLSSKFLGPDDSNVVGNITHYVHIPATFPLGDAVLTGALFSLIGAGLEPNTDVFTFNVTVVNATSS